MSIRILVLSDTHVPDRAESIPDHVIESINAGKPYDIVIHAGDLTGDEVLTWAKSLASKVLVVEGNVDYLSLPRFEETIVEGIRIGVYHGHGVYPRGNVVQLTSIANRLGVDVLVSGHTHYPFIKEYEGVLHLNPGSLTGAWGGGGGSMKPSFMVVEVSSGELLVELFEDVDGEMKVTKRFKWSKT